MFGSSVQSWSAWHVKLSTLLSVTKILPHCCVRAHTNGHAPRLTIHVYFAAGLAFDAFGLSYGPQGARRWIKLRSLCSLWEASSPYIEIKGMEWQAQASAAPRPTRTQICQQSSIQQLNVIANAAPIRIAATATVHPSSASVGPAGGQWRVV
jgi:hypothetical protein